MKGQHRIQKLSSKLVKVLIILSFFFSNFFLSAKEPSAKNHQTFEQKIKPILNKYCYNCHDEDVQKGDLRLDTLNFDIINASNRDIESWHDALNNIQRGDMPPEKKAQPTREERGILVAWLREQLEAAEKKRHGDAPQVTLKRLTRYEYNNTLQDLLGVKMDFTEGLPPEGLSEEGFKNNGQVLSISPIQYEYYLKLARKAVQSVIFTGERPEPVKLTFEKSSGLNFHNQPVSRYDPEKKLTYISAKHFKMLCQIPDQLTHLYPYKGWVRVRVKASATVSEGADYPAMQLTLGCKTGGEVEPEKQLGEICKVSPGEFKTYDFVGRMEEFPSNEPAAEDERFSGMIIKIRNLFDNGKVPQVKSVKLTKEDRALKKKKSYDYSAVPGIPEIIVKSVEFEFPFVETWPPATHKKLLGSSSEEDLLSIQTVLKEFMERAFRRPVELEEVKRFFGLYEKIRPNFKSYEEAMTEVLATVLISPEFLYQTTFDTKGNTALTGHELATRLSYFLWSTMPDSELFDLAKQGKLRDEKTLRQQVKRMIENKRSWQFVTHFGSQWLGLGKIDQVAINPLYYPDFKDEIKEDLKQETLSFIGEIFYKDMSCLNIIDSDFTMLNTRLGNHYNIKGAEGMEFKAVKLDGELQRGGVLSHGSILMINSDGEDSHPVKRAVWMLDSILGIHPPNPPADVDTALDSSPNVVKLSLKQQLELHRKKEACNDCHRKIDPWGIAFENFDAVGRWREKVRRVVNKKKSNYIAVDSSSTLPGGKKNSGLQDLKNYLLKNKKDQFAQSLVRKLMTYALGRSLKITDQDMVEELSGKFKRSDYKLSALIEEIVVSKTFLSR